MKKINESIINLEIYTDGSSKKIGTALFGGWAFLVLRGGEKIYWAADSEQGATNQRMELTAILKALEYAHENRRPSERVIIYSDSAYAINCYKQQWYLNWINNNWKNSQKKDVANQDLWRQIIPYYDSFWYNFYKVEGHSGIQWNEECDKLAQQEANNLKLKWRGYYGK